MLFTYLLILIPISWAVALLHASPLAVFIIAAAAIIPLAEWIRRSTEQLALHAGSAIGGLLNVTFGNSAELILAIIVLKTGNTEVVKATITGSIIGNSLLGLGLAIVAGSWHRERQAFSRERAGLLASLLILSVIALMLPAFFDYTERALAKPQLAALDEHLSIGVSVVLIVMYMGNLIYTLITHRDAFAVDDERQDSGSEDHPRWSATRSLVTLLVATAAVAGEAELVSGAIEATAQKLALTPFFLGIIVLPFVGNAAEYVGAVYFARKNRMGLVMGIAVGSSIQVALLTAPLLVLISFVIGHPMNLVFANPLELIAIAAVAFAVNSIAQDGETTWFEGMLLLGVYALLAVTFYFVT